MNQVFFVGYNPEKELSTFFEATFPEKRLMEGFIK